MTVRGRAEEATTRGVACCVQDSAGKSSRQVSVTIQSANGRAVLAVAPFDRKSSRGHRPATPSFRNTALITRVARIHSNKSHAMQDVAWWPTRTTHYTDTHLALSWVTGGMGLTRPGLTFSISVASFMMAMVSGCDGGQGRVAQISESELRLKLSRTTCADQLQA